uniref:Uncharacterized protein n=1 Tax=Acrobeloides nanus TaxID=290746 RepID=A0A914BUM0_9BILA
MDSSTASWGTSTSNASTVEPSIILKSAPVANMMKTPLAIAATTARSRRQATTSPDGVPMDDEFPETLKQLFLKTHPTDNHFHDRIRNLNSSFTMASFYVDKDHIPSSDIYAFNIQGQVYHMLNFAAHPTQDA